MPSIIMPAGGSKVEWSPNPEAEKTEKKVAVDPQFDAIRNLPGIKAQAESLDLESAEEVQEEVKAEENPAAAAVQEVAKAAEEVKEKVEEAVEKVVEVAQEAVEAVKAGAEAVVEKAEEKPAEEKKEDEVAEIAVIVEEEPEIPGVVEDGTGKVEKETCVASDKGQFVRIAALSPQNRKDLVDYWKNMLGFEPEYVDAMVKDYEE